MKKKQHTTDKQIVDFLLKENEELIEETAALRNRCSVAEDLNKVYVRMYLEMQDRYDSLAARAAGFGCPNSAIANIQELVHKMDELKGSSVVPDSWRNSAGGLE